MRSIWKGAINFGMVAIPAKLYSAVEDKRVSFHQMHSPCGSRVSMPKWCAQCGRKVETTEIKKGYEVSEGKHIILEETDLASLPLKSIKTVEVVEFVPAGCVDPRYLSDCYYLACEDTGLKAYTLFRKAMETKSVVAIAKLTYREREHLALIRSFDGVMVLHTLHYPDEVRSPSEIKPKESAVSDKEMELAIMLVGKMLSECLDLTKYHNDYREALEKLIEAKLSGTAVPAVAEKPAVSDTVEALLASLEAVGVK